MTDGIGRIGSGSSSGVNSWYLKREPDKEDINQQNAQAQAQTSYSKEDIDESKVWAFMANNSAFNGVVAPEKTRSFDGVGDVDAGLAERMEDWMAKFEEFYAIIEEEVGSELAPAVMDLVMDKLMGMA